MVIKVQGVYENGAVPSSTAPPLVAVEVPISFAAGEDVTIEMTVVDPAGEPVDITDMDFSLGIREFDFDADPKVARNGVVQDGPAGRVDYTLVPIDTKDLSAPGPYRWSSWVVDAGRGSQLVLASDLELRAPGLTSDEVGLSDDAWVAEVVAPPGPTPIPLTGEHTWTNTVGEEDVVPQAVYVDFDDVDWPTVLCRLMGTVRVSGGTGTFRARVGGTRGVADGTIVAEGTTTSLTDTPANFTAAAFAKPAGQQLLQVTGKNGTVGQSAIIKDISISLRSGT